jgi:8-oxo-dGTP diphosphatase
MSLAGQRIQSDRYTVVPRTLTFLLRDDHVLLIRLSRTRGAWSGLFNGIGGHVEQGEDPLTSARREILEETGLHPIDLRLCGVMAIDVGSAPGIALYVLVGQAGPEMTSATPEGEPSWEALDSLSALPLVQDIPMVLPRALEAYRTGVPFSAITSYDSAGEMHLHFAP